MANYLETANMILNDHFKEMFCVLSAQNVKFMLVGGYAFAAYGRPRATLDIDFFVEASPENAEATYKALAEFGAPLETLKITKSDLASEGTIVQLGVQPNRIDIINKINGVDFADAYQRSRMEKIDGFPVRVISLEDLYVNKKSTGRDKDLGDIKTLEYLLKIKKPAAKPAKQRKTVKPIKQNKTK